MTYETTSPIIQFNTLKVNEIKTTVRFMKTCYFFAL